MSNSVTRYCLGVETEKGQYEPVFISITGSSDIGFDIIRYPEWLFDVSMNADGSLAIINRSLSVMCEAIAAHAWDFLLLYLWDKNTDNFIKVEPNAIKRLLAYIENPDDEVELPDSSGIIPATWPRFTGEPVPPIDSRQEAR